MHDIRAIRDDAAVYARGWSSRGVADAEGVVAQILDLDTKLRVAQTSFQTAQARRNEASKLIGAAKAKKDEAGAQNLMAEVAALKGEIEQHSADEAMFATNLRNVLAALPNLAAPEVPEGEDEAGNVEVRRWRDRSAVPAGKINATPKDHVALGEALGMMDFEAAARMSGSRFVVLKQELARAGAGARPIHARFADRGARLYRGEPAAAGERRGAVRDGAIAEVRAGFIFDQRYRC